MKCAVTATAAPNSFTATGGTGTLSIATNRECQWSAAALSAWIKLDGATTGQGEASVTFSVGANGDAAVRKSGIAIGDDQVAITQDAAPCVFTVNPRSDSVGAAGGRKTITVGASSAQCAWSAQSDADWIAVVQGAHATGNGQVEYEARASGGPARSGTLTVAGQAVTVTQNQDCSTSIAPVARTVPASGGAFSMTVTTDAGCTWSARSDAAWIVIASGQAGVGSGTIAFNVNPSDGPARSGTITIDGHVLTVSQESGCRYPLDPASQSFTDAGGPGGFTVGAGAGCGWTAVSTAPWIGVTAGASGTGTGTVGFVVDTNVMGIPARTGTIVVNNQAFTINQAAGAPCVYAIAPMSQGFGAAGGSGGFAVTTVLTCPWTAYSNDSWIGIVGPPSGAGNGNISFTVAPNSGAPRTGSISLRGQTFTVSQAGASGQ